MRILLIVCLGLLASCASTVSMSQTQIDTLETREIDASHDMVFDAAANAIVEAGYSVNVTDRDGGVLTGEKIHEAGVAPQVGVAVATFVLTMGHGIAFIPPTDHGVCVQLTPLSSTRTAVRVCVYKQNVAISDPAVVDQVWTLMLRRVLRKAPVNQ